MTFEEAKKKYKAPIIDNFNGFLILAQSKADLEVKRKRISYGDTLGFIMLTEKYWERFI